MIKDREIDLTVERKFNSGFATINFYNKAIMTQDKLFNIKRRSRFVDPLDITDFGIKPSTYLPWNNRPIESDNDLGTRVRRSYKDEISDYFGETLRLTENNGIMILGRAKRVNPEVIEEFFIETIGSITPYTPINICFSCGRKRISSYKNNWMYGLCNTCSNIRGVPWKG